MIKAQRIAALRITRVFFLAGTLPEDLLAV